MKEPKQRTINTNQNRSNTFFGRNKTEESLFFRKGNQFLSMASFSTNSNKIQRKKEDDDTQCDSFRKEYFDSLIKEIKSKWDNKIDCTDPNYLNVFQDLISELRFNLHTHSIDPNSGRCCTTVYKFLVEKNEIVTILPKPNETLEIEGEPLGEPVKGIEPNPIWDWQPTFPSTPQKPTNDEEKPKPSDNKKPESSEKKEDEQPKSNENKEENLSDPCKPVVRVEEFYSGYENLKDLFEDWKTYETNLKIKGGGEIKIKLFEGYISEHPECLV